VTRLWGRTRFTAPSVRLQLTLLVAVVTALALSLLVWQGMQRTEERLVDRALDEIEDFSPYPFPGVLVMRDDNETSPEVDLDLDLDALTVHPFVVERLNLLRENVDGPADTTTADIFSRLGVTPAAPLPVQVANGYIALIGLDGSVEIQRAGDRLVVGLDLMESVSFDVDPVGLATESADADGPEEYAYRVVDMDGGPVLIGRPVSDIRSTVSTVRLGLWAATPVLVVLAALAAWWLAGRALRPVRQITERVNTITSGATDATVPVPPTRDEVADLATTMNAMLARLASAERDRKQFVSDASHELRSPVAILRGEAELIAARSEDGEARRLADVVLAEASRLEQLVGSLLALARVDEGRRVAATVIDLDDVVLEEVARPRRLAIDVAAVSAGQVRASREAMRTVLQHLLDNAVRHANTRVAVAVRVEDDSVLLDVIDDGPGVPPQDAHRVFDRFARLDEARQRDAGGAGLGLAVVAALVSEAGGSVAVQPSDSGAHFRVSLPSANAR
jgi:signal transduction histidine kinase